MKFVFPIENYTAEMLYGCNNGGDTGFYPIGLNNSYHGGIHIQGDFPVVAIADGTLIAYRYTKKYIEEQGKESNKKYRYSNCFMLVRHEYKTPNGQGLVFFSHYNHLCPWEEFNETKKSRLPKPFSKPGFRITTNGLKIRSSPEKTATNEIPDKAFKTDDEVAASDLDGTWAKKEGVEEYFKHQGNAEPISLPKDPTFDSVVSCEIPVKVGDLMGYTGLYEMQGLPEAYTIVHLEVFAGDDTGDFINNKKKDGEKKPTHYRVAKATALKKKEKKYPDTSTLTKSSLKADTTVTVTEKSASGAWVKVQENAIYKSYKKTRLDHQLINEVHHYTVKTDYLADIKTVFGKNNITTGTLFKLQKQLAGDDRIIELVIPEAQAKKVWIKTACLSEIKNNSAYVKVDASECFNDNPDVEVFTASAGKTADEIEGELKGLEKTTDASKKIWYKIGAGWIADDNTAFKKISVFDWPGFKIAKEEGGAANDMVINFNKLNPFFKKIIDEINTDKNKEISEAELKYAQKLPELSRRLSRLICFHRSEWWYEDGMSWLNDLLAMIGKKTRRKTQDTAPEFMLVERGGG